MLERRIRLTTLVCAAATAWTAAAAAQQPALPESPVSISQPAAPVAPAPAAAPANVLFLARGAPIMPVGGNIDIVAGEGSVMGKVVTDEPYSASSITESTQMLADGNRIVNRNEARIYRDSAGRTRREQTLNALGVWQAGNEPVTMVTINDPVAGTSYVLNPADHTARQVQPFKLARKAASDSAAPDSAVAPPLPPTPPGGDAAGPRVLVRAYGARRIPPGAVAGETGANDGEPTQETAISRTVTIFDAPVPAPNLDVALVARGQTGPGSSTTEDLGDQILQGVTAHGTRQTRTIPAGEIGNERPIEIVSEQWYSPELEAVVLRRDSDPRFGETTYKLVDVERSEPPPDLFRVPQDYTLVNEAPQGFFGVETARPGAAENGPRRARTAPAAGH